LIDNLKEVVAVEADEQLANAKYKSHCKRQHLKRNIITVLYSRNIFPVMLLHCAFRKKRALLVALK
jgi:hypothetical protein